MTISKWWSGCKTHVRNLKHIQSHKSGLKGHGCYLHRQNQDIELKFESWVYQRPVTIYKQWSWCQTPVRILLHPSKPHIRPWRTLIFFAPSKSSKSQNVDHWCIKNLWSNQIMIMMPNPNQKIQHPPKSPSGFIGHGCSSHIQNQDKELKLGTCVYQRLVTISKSWSRCQTPVRHLQHSQKPQIRT